MVSCAPFYSLLALGRVALKTVVPGSHGSATHFPLVKSAMFHNHSLSYEYRNICFIKMVLFVINP